MEWSENNDRQAGKSGRVLLYECSRETRQRDWQRGQINASFNKSSKLLLI